MNDSTTGDRVVRLRKLRGLTQQELAARAGVSYRTVRTVEQDEAAVRRSTLHAIARALHVRTADLLQSREAERPDPLEADPWEDVRAALYQPPPGDGEPASERGVLRGVRQLMPLLASNRYDEARRALPALIQDAAALNGDGRLACARVWNTTAWLLTQTRQWEDALTAGWRALDAAPDQEDKVAAVSTLCWCLLRQGRLAQARDLAVRWADEAEPRISRASAGELAGWGKLWLYIANASTRNNEPGAAEDALRIAEAAARRIGREVETDESTTRTFGPVAVSMIRAESLVLLGQPDMALRIAGRIPEGELVHATSASSLRHRLNVASAHACLRQYREAVDVLDRVRVEAPEWLRVQRAARDVVEQVVERRRTLTSQMREVAAAVRLDLS